jgi:hypothetical protein
MVPLESLLIQIDLLALAVHVPAVLCGTYSMSGSIILSRSFGDSIPRLEAASLGALFRMSTESLWLL